MSNVNLSLDDIIAKQGKTSKSGRNVGGFRSDKVARSNGAGGGRGGSFAASKVPAGRWKHDRYNDLDAPQLQTRSGPKIGPGLNSLVRVNISNLAPTVVTADLEELFEAYNLETAAVHYSEAGESLGTGDIFLKKKDALKVLDDFKAVALDGQRLVLTLVDGGGSTVGKPSIASRLNVAPRGGIQKRKAAPNPTHFLDRLAEDAGFNGRSAGRARGAGAVRGRAKRPGNPRVKLTNDDLDKELEEYMNKGGKKVAVTPME